MRNRSKIVWNDGSGGVWNKNSFTRRYGEINNLYKIYYGSTLFVDYEAEYQNEIIGF